MLEGVTPQIESVLAAGSRAPSFYNTQPWQFKVSGNKIQIHTAESESFLPYDTDHLASNIAIGAAVENMTLAAGALGLSSAISYFPANDPTCVAVVELTPQSAATVDDLEKEVFLRVTNRKKFMPISPSEKERVEMTNVVQSYKKCALYMTDKRKDIDALAAAMTSVSELAFSNQTLHQVHFRHINWTQEEDAAKGTGFFLQALEMPMIASALMYVLKDWTFAQYLNVLGFSRYISSYFFSTYKTAGIIGAITVLDEEPATYVQTGQAFQRFWLLCTKLGYNIEPLHGLALLKYAQDKNAAQFLTSPEQDVVSQGYKSFQDSLDIADKRIVCIFRLGGGSVAKYHDSRVDLNKKVALL